MAQQHVLVVARTSADWTLQGTAVVIEKDTGDIVVFVENDVQTGKSRRCFRPQMCEEMTFLCSVTLKGTTIASAQFLRAKLLASTE